MPDTIYHITMRGNAQQDIVTSDAERALFLELLSSTVTDFQWICHAYCLMNNHYHLVVQIERENLSEGMQRLNGRYAAAINSRKRRSGHLFEGRFHSNIVDTEAYFFNVICYIVLNPVRAFLVKHPVFWPWSSYQKTAFGGSHPEFVNPDFIWSMLGDDRSVSREVYFDFINEWLEEEHEVSRPFPEQEPRIRLHLDEIFEDQSRGRNDHIEEAYFVHAYKIREIAEYCGISKSMVGKFVRRAPQKVDKKVDGA
jgi:putative transposase